MENKTVFMSEDNDVTRIKTAQSILTWRFSSMEETFLQTAKRNHVRHASGPFNMSRLSTEWIW
eukprot:6094225-Amphidinium_carterae.1